MTYFFDQNYEVVIGKNCGTKRINFDTRITLHQYYVIKEVIVGEIFISFRR